MGSADPQGMHYTLIDDVDRPRQASALSGACHILAQTRDPIQTILLDEAPHIAKSSY